MIHPFEQLRSEYAQLLATMVITRRTEVDYVVDARPGNNLLACIDAGRYAAACAASGGIPEEWAAASFEREASSNFALSPAQGDRWDRASVHVPAHRGPFASWEAAAIDAYAIDHLNEVGAANWTWERACYEGELFNGFGYRAHGVHSPYLWSGTNHYARGKYVADGEWNAEERDEQLGIVPMMAVILQARPELKLANPFPASIQPPEVTSPPMPAPEGHHDGEALQEALNKLDDAGLQVDGSYGRFTRNAVIAFQAKHHLQVDGIAGPATWAAIVALLKAA